VQIEEGYSKGIKAALKIAKKYGLQMVKTQKRMKHPKFRGITPDGKKMQFSTSATTSDNARALKNFEGEIRRAGFKTQEIVKGPKPKLSSPTTTVQKPTKRTADQGTTFKDFMDKIRSQVTDEKKPSTVASRMAKGWRRSIRELPASEKFRVGDDIIRQLRREAYSEAEKRSHVKPKPVEIQTITRSAKDDGKYFHYREVLPKKGIYHNTPVAPTVLPKKKDKPVWKYQEFQYPGMPIKDLLRGGTTL